MQKLSWHNEAEFHKGKLAKIKENIKASYVSYERYKDYYQLKVVKDKREDYFPLQGAPKDVTADKYKQLEKMLKEFYA